MADLHTTYMGFELNNPLLPSASPLSRKLDDIKALEDAGAPGVVLYSLFEEQVALESGELSHLLQEGAASLQGKLSLQHYVEPTAFERASYIKLLQGYVRI